MKNWYIRLLLLLCASVLFCAGCVGTGKEIAEEGSEISATGGAAESGKEGGSEESEKESDEERVRIPDFEMTLVDGVKATFDEYRGKKVLLNFWATWCGPCVGEMPAFQKLADEYPEGLVILAVNCGEDQKTVQKFIRSNGYSFPVVLDEEGDIQSVFGGITSIPVTVIIDEEGYVVSSHTGASGADEMYEVYKKELGL